MAQRARQVACSRTVEKGYPGCLLSVACCDAQLLIQHMALVSVVRAFWQKLPAVQLVQVPAI